jgi:hypothetical protein
MTIVDLFIHLWKAAVSGFVIALVLNLFRDKPSAERAADHDARETAETALAAIARLREELSVLRGETLRDRDEIRDELTKQGRILQRMGTDVKDAVERCMSEATKITMHMGNMSQKKF